MSSFLVETLNYTEAGGTNTSDKSLHPPGDVENIHDAGTGSVSSRFPLRPALLCPPLPHKRQMSPAAQKFCYLRVNTSKPTGGLRGWEIEREGEQINDK